ncbi:RelA/SpoT family protein [Dyadobacter sandarakinus]|uniref:Bifunctional (P)ppGpp synthetase/guanosine-3',5'-bis(Diphosphate) 3'-pyrophosphohydrolase n=1 Tax=Dyadobacter sandarakinus TaxID=2747268 RepID=A0ABX7ICM4_9BACT|nr:bifunctional (p)ppGpp synthetase/guanosine-3',5'-bis(diphosphate) 3'-pyrophosphohydrolase [Dyadobacter sandarakinus]QRR03478.1 bifunctional (p)ppGpp synthetase/guanosine-3',5'-bis(diphosphate) 3'-pyrophosphohydrolase [Dyadobacter sandarakinus]
MEQLVESLNIDLEQERKDILKKYRRLLRTAKPYLKDNDAKLIKKAFYTSVDAHKDMRRRSGEPYIYHPLAVAQIVVEEIGLGTTGIVSALLHDVVEDTDMRIEDIERLFGKKVAKIIDGLTKISGRFEYGTSQQAENFRKMLLTLSDDVRVILVKLADRLHNMRTLDSMPRDKQLKIASETIFIYAPLAHRLGLYSIKSELEELYLKYTEPQEYRAVARKLRETKNIRDRFIAKFMEPIAQDLEAAGLNFILKGRPKSIYSIWNKMRKQNKPFEEIYDLFAIRIVLESPPESDREKAICWQAYSIVTDHYKPNPDRLKDFLSTPRANGYQSLHSTVMSKSGQWVEVQIRTSRMDEIAEKGYAAHWKYKGNDTKVRGNIEQWITQVRETLENGFGDKTAAIEFLDEFRSNLFNEEVFVFTPKGELKVLQSGATALDFAFDIHSEVGAHCMAAKVGGALVPISYVLNNGDQIEIITSGKQKPNEDWLRIVVTSKARGRIKDFLKEENRRYETDGRQMTEKKLKTLGIDLTSEVANQLRAFFECKTQTDFFYRIGKGYIQLDELKRFKRDKEIKERKLAESSGNNNSNTVNPASDGDGKAFTKFLKHIHGDRADSDTLLIGDDMDKIDYKLAQCCNPIAGDDVFGFVTINEGIKIHRTTCPNAAELMSKHGNRIIKAKWESNKQEAFLAGLYLSGTDRVGLVNDVTRIISNELHINMRGLTIDTKDGVFNGDIKLYVQDTRHLDILIAKLEQVEGVYNVQRFDNNLTDS